MNMCGPVSVDESKKYTQDLTYPALRGSYAANSAIRCLWLLVPYEIALQGCHNTRSDIQHML